MSGGGSGGNQTSQTVNMPYGGIAPGMTQAAVGAQNIASLPYQQYGGQRIAGLSPEQQQGLLMTSNRAQAGSPVLNQAQGELQRTLGGGYLGYSPGSNPYLGQAGGTNQYAGANPYLEQNIQSTLGDVSRDYATGTAAQTDAAAARAGAFGSSGHGQLQTMHGGELAKRLGEISGGMRMQDYGMQQQLAEAALGRQQQDLARNAGLSEAGLGRAADLYGQERGRMMQANLFAPQMAEADYRDAQALLGVGDVRREYSQDMLNQQYQDFLAQQQWPYMQNDYLTNTINRLQGGFGTSTTTGDTGYKPNRAASALGGAASGAAIGSLFGPGYGTAIGAGIGGLSGLLLR